MGLKEVQGVQEFKEFEERSWGPGEAAVKSEM
jgi:hypothetical protein